MQSYDAASPTARLREHRKRETTTKHRGRLALHSAGRPPRWGNAQQMTLLHFVQLLVDQHRHQHQQKDPRTDAEYAHRNRQPVDLDQ